MAVHAVQVCCVFACLGDTNRAVRINRRKKTRAGVQIETTPKWCRQDEPSTLVQSERELFRYFHGLSIAYGFPQINMSHIVISPITPTMNDPPPREQSRVNLEERVLPYLASVYDIVMSGTGCYTKRQ